LERRQFLRRTTAAGAATIGSGTLTATALGTETAAATPQRTGPLRVDIGGGRITGKLKVQPAKNGARLLQGQLSTEGVEVSALTAPSRMLTGKLKAQTTLKAEFREPGQLGDALQTQTSFTVQDAVITGIDQQTVDDEKTPERWQTSGPSDWVLVQARYDWKLFIPELSMLSNYKNGDEKMYRMTAGALFRNEPYGG